MQLAPWGWMLEMDLFGVSHPHTGDIGFCSVLTPDNFRYPGLAIYKGQAGLFSYEFMQDWGMDIPGFGQVQEQHCLLLAFVEGDQLLEEERANFLRYGFAKDRQLIFPSFRDYTPGWVPWPIQSQEEATWIMVAMEQTLHVANRFRADKDLLDHVEAEEPKLLLRQPIKLGQDTMWEDSWITINSDPKPAYNVKGDTLYLRSNLSEFPKRSDMTWLIEYLYSPQPVYEESERPCLPRLFFIADATTQTRLGFRVVKPGAENRHIQALLVEVIKSQGYIPHQIVVGQISSMSFWGDICRILGIQLQLDRDHPLFPRLRNDWFGSYAL